MLEMPLYCVVPILTCKYGKTKVRINILIKQNTTGTVKNIRISVIWEKISD